MNATVIKLIVRRFALKLGCRIWSGWLSIIIAFSFFLGAMYVLSFYECSIRRALGYPSVKPPGYRNPPFFRREHDCQEENAADQQILNPTPDRKKTARTFSPP